MTLSVNLCASTQDRLFCPKISSETSWVVMAARSHAPCMTICPRGKRWVGARAGWHPADLERQEWRTRAAEAPCGLVSYTL